MRFVFFLLTATLSIAGEFTTFLGAGNPYTIAAITTDSTGNTYVVGSRQLGTPPAIVFDLEYIPPDSDVFVSKLDPNGKLLFTDTFGGKGVDTGSAIAVDPSGNIGIGITTTPPRFPLIIARQTHSNSTYGTASSIKLGNDGSTILKPT